MNLEEIKELKNEDISRYFHEEIFGKCWHDREMFACSKCHNPQHWIPNLNYCQSLDAVAEVEKIIERKGLAYAYAENLALVKNVRLRVGYMFAFITATARHKAEALLLTLQIEQDSQRCG